MPKERAVFGGLNTDSPPDRLGDQAYYLQNVRPVSATSIRPREGVASLATYTTLQEGSSLVIDALPQSSDGILLTIINSRFDVNGTWTRTNEFVMPFFPSSRPTDLSNVSGVDDVYALYGVFL